MRIIIIIIPFFWSYSFLLKLHYLVSEHNQFSVFGVLLLFPKGPISRTILGPKILLNRFFVLFNRVLLFVCLVAHIREPRISPGFLSAEACVPIKAKLFFCRVNYVLHIVCECNK